MARAFGVLRHGGFGYYLLARFLATLAVQMLVVAVGWQVYEATHDPLDLGLIGLSQFLPFIVLVLPAGHVADHSDRRRIVAACFALQALGAVLLLAATRAGLPQVWPVFAIMGLFGIARAFSMPAAQALLPNMVPVASYGNAVALNSSSMQVSRIAGPALGGLLYFAGADAVYATVAVLLAVSCSLILGARLAGGASPLSTAPNPALGNAIGVVSGCCWSLTLLGLRWLEKRDPSSKGAAAGNAAVVGNILAFAGCLPLALPVSDVGAVDVLGVAYLGVFQVGFSYVLLTRSITHVPAVDASLLLLVEPALSPVWAWLLHGEAPGLWPLAGGVLIIGAAAWKASREGRAGAGARAAG